SLVVVFSLFSHMEPPVTLEQEGRYRLTAGLTAEIRMGLADEEFENVDEDTMVGTGVSVRSVIPDELVEQEAMGNEAAEKDAAGNKQDDTRETKKEKSGEQREDREE
ncbi:hypothetical protein PENTCL1PPCAC_23636, partial [Pristionchus entomophagus]